MITLINIVSAPRSGSTLLDAMLGSGDLGCSLGEAAFFFRPVHKHNRKVDCCCGDAGCAFWKRVNLASARSFHQQVVDSSGAEYLVDSSKNLNWVVDTYRYNPDFRIINVVIWKDLEKLAYSHWKRDEDCIANLKKYSAYLHRFLSLQLPFVSVELSALSSDPERILKQLCSSIGISYDLKMTRFWEQEHHFLYGSYGVQQQIRGGKAFIYKEDVFPEAFNHTHQSVTRYIEDDAKTKKLLITLKEHDVSKETAVKFEGRKPVRPLPLWYYYRGAARYMRSFLRTEYKIKDVNYIYGK